MWWEMFSCNINSQCCRNMNMIIICVGWWSVIFTLTGCDWLPHVLISCSNVVMCSRTTSEKWHFGKISLWEPEQSLAGEHQPAIFSWSTDSDCEHKTRTRLTSLKGREGFSSLLLHLHTSVLRGPQAPRLIWLKWVDINIWRRGAAVVMWPGDQETRRDQVVVRGESYGGLSLSLFSLTHLTCVKSPSPKVTRKCCQWS